MVLLKDQQINAGTPDLTARMKSMIFRKVLGAGGGKALNPGLEKGNELPLSCKGLSCHSRPVLEIRPVCHT